MQPAWQGRQARDRVRRLGLGWRSLAPGLWPRVCGPGSVVLGLWSWVCGPPGSVVHLVCGPPGLWSWVCGLRYLAPGLWPLVCGPVGLPGAGSGFFVYGPWSLCPDSQWPGWVDCVGWEIFAPVIMLCGVREDKDAGLFYHVKTCGVFFIFYLIKLIQESCLDFWTNRTQSHSFLCLEIHIT